MQLYRNDRASLMADLSLSGFKGTQGDLEVAYRTLDLSLTTHALSAFGKSIADIPPIILPSVGSSGTPAPDHSSFIGLWSALPVILNLDVSYTTTYSCNPVVCQVDEFSLYDQ